MSLDDLQRHYDTFYSPNNATLIVVGDIKAEALLPTIKRLFEPIPKGPTPKQLLPAEPEQRGERRFILKREAQVPFVMMGFRVPNYSSDDSYALDVLESILSRGKSSQYLKDETAFEEFLIGSGLDEATRQAALRGLTGVSLSDVAEAVLYLCSGGQPENVVSAE